MLGQPGAKGNKMRITPSGDEEGSAIESKYDPHEDIVPPIDVTDLMQAGSCRSSSDQPGGKGRGDAVKVIAPGDRTILVVEDEPMILKMVVTMLQRLGYVVLAAGTSSDAIGMIMESNNKIDLVLTDVVMPGMNGRALAERLLADQPETKFLYMSGYTANIIADQGVLDEGTFFIQKPFSKNELAAKVREALDDR
jgi:CheY-like chemotaxis protein